MPTDHPRDSPTQQRKSTLIAQGASYRTGIARSKVAVKANLHADALAISAVRHIAARTSVVAGALLSLNGLRKGDMRALAPLVGSGVSWLAKRKALKPMARGVVALAAIGAGAYFLIRKRGATRSAPAQSESAPSE